MKKRLPVLMISLLILGVSALGLTNCLAEQGIFKTISSQEFADLIGERDGEADFVILDVRTPAEYEKGHIQKAVLLDYYSKAFVPDLKGLDKSKTYLIYCRSGNRSGKTLDLMKKLEFQEAYNLQRGINGWSKKGFPLTR